MRGEEIGLIFMPGRAGLIKKSESSDARRLDVLDGPENNGC